MFPGIGPVEAIRGALAKAFLSIEDIDVSISSRSLTVANVVLTISQFRPVV